MSDQATAARLIDQGDRFLQGGDIQQLSQIIGQLMELC